MATRVSQLLERARVVSCDDCLYEWDEAGAEEAVMRLRDMIREGLRGFPV